MMEREHMAETASEAEPLTVARLRSPEYRWSADYKELWTPEFREWGIDISKKLVNLVVLPDKLKYEAPAIRAALDASFKEWKRWFELDTERSHRRKPFDPEKDLGGLPEPAAEDFVPERVLAGLPPAKELFDTYQQLLIDPNSVTPEQLNNYRTLASLPGASAEQAVRRLLRGYVENRDDAYRVLAEGKEIYWRPLYADYFEVTARTKRQFEIAVETFIRWVRSGLGRAPEEIFRKVNSFKETLTAVGQRAGLEEYTKGKRLELEILAAIVGADFSNEHYNADYFKQFWTFGSKDEGPERMLQLIKSNKGILAAVIWKFDQDKKLELLFAPHGPRGELMIERNAKNMGDLEEQVKAMLIREVLGISLKRYNPDDPEMRIPGNNSIYEANLNEITKFKSDEDFKNLYEGFDVQEQERLRQRLEERNEGDLKPAEEELKVRLERAKRVRDYLEAGYKLEDIKLENIKLKLGLEEKEMNEMSEMYEEAKNVVALAFELYGAMGEKAKRQGAVFLVHRKDSFGRPIVDYIPNHWAEKFLHLSENWTKATYGGELDQELQERIGRERLSSNEYSRLENELRPDTSDERRREIEGILRPKGIFADELKYRVGQNRRLAIWALKTKGSDAKLWDFTLLRDGRPVDPNTLGYTKYGVDRNREDPIERYKYADPVDIRILGYNSNGEEVILVFDDEGKPVEGVTTGLAFDPQSGKPLIFDKKPGEERRSPIIFDNLTRNTRARKLLLRRPKEEEVEDPETGKKVKRVVKNPDGNSVVEKVHVDFETVRDKLSSHPYARWTAHPYWGYQEEDPGLLLSRGSFDAARKIKRGELRPEDAPPHAVQLLIVDPTLDRVRHFDHLENVECAVALAAVEESYQAHWRIEDELYANFFPRDASRTEVRVQYVLQDRGGSTKQWFHIRAEAAYWSDAKARRLRIFIPFIPLHFASMSEMWGAPGGALDVFRMMGYEKYKMVGQFAMDKWVNQTGAVQDIYEAFADSYNAQQKKIDEGLGRKLNNDADVHMKKHYQQVMTTKELQPDVSTREDTYEEFLVSSRESLYRMERVEHRNTVSETYMRGERSPLWLEGREVFKRKSDGSYEPDENGNRILDDRVNKEIDSGSSRHSNKLFHFRYARFLRSPEGGQVLYPDTARYYALLDNDLNDYTRLVEEYAGTGKTARHVSGWDWLEGKMNN